MSPAPLPRWPLVAVIAGLPLWWLVGLLPFVPAVLALTLLMYLIVQRDVVLVPGTGILAAFVAWAAACIVMIDAPLRATGFAIRWSTLAAALLTIVYLTNTVRALPTARVLRLMAVPWALLILGGYLALLLPNGSFTTPVGYLLPQGLLSNELVQGLVQPRFAEVQQPFGALFAFNRPSAPFPYANSWGAAFAYLAPLMLALRHSLRTRLRLVLDLSFLAALPPALATANRGMWIILAVAVLYALIRLVCWGRARAATMTVAVIAVAAAAFVAFGGAELISERLEVSKTTEGRASVYGATFEQTLTSPLMGFGAPRASEEIDVALGTQGAAWMYMYSYGFVGLGLFLAFLIATVVRSGRRLPPRDLWLHACLVSALVGIWFYGLDFVHLLILAVAAGLVMRRGKDGTLPVRIERPA